MIGIATSDKEIIAIVTNADYLKFREREQMPSNYDTWRRAALNGHGNPIFEDDGSRLYFAAPKAKATHTVVEGEDEYPVLHSKKCHGCPLCGANLR